MVTILVLLYWSRDSWMSFTVAITSLKIVVRGMVLSTIHDLRSCLQEILFNLVLVANTVVLHSISVSVIRPPHDNLPVKNGCMICHRYFTVCSNDLIHGWCLQPLRSYLWIQFQTPAMMNSDNQHILIQPYWGPSTDGEAGRIMVSTTGSFDGEDRRTAYSFSVRDLGLGPV